MPPMKRTGTRPTTGRRPATAPAQSRRNAAAAPSRAAVAEVDEQDPAEGFVGSDDAEEVEDEELPTIIDLSSAKAPDRSVLPRGWYDGYIESVEYGLSQSKGLPMLTFYLKIYTGEVDEDSGEQKERSLRWYLTLTGDGAGNTKASLARLDPELDLSTLEPDAMDEYFSDAQVRVRVTIRPDRDDRKIKRNNVSDVVPLDGEEAVEE